MGSIMLQFPEELPLPYRLPEVKVGKIQASDVIFDDEPGILPQHGAIVAHDGALIWRPLEGQPVPFPGGGLLLAGEPLRAWLDDDEQVDPADAALASDPGADPGRLASLAARSGSLLRLVAANPSAPPSLLSSFACYHDRAVVEALCSNPATPRSLLLRRCHRFPALFWQNPQAELMMLEDPFLRGFSGYQLSLMLVSRAAPLWCLRHFLGHPSESVREFAARALKTRGEG